MTVDENKSNSPSIELTTKGITNQTINSNPNNDNHNHDHDVVADPIASPKSFLKEQMSKKDSIYNEKRMRSPFDTATWLSKIFYTYLTPIMELGKSRPLQDNDLPDVPEFAQAEKLSAIFEQKWAIELTKPKPDIFRAIRSCFPYKFWFAACCKVISDAFTFLQPILLGWLIDWTVDIQSDDNPPAVGDGYAYSVALLICPFLTSIFLNMYYALSMTMGLQSRAILITAIYKKSLKLSPAARANLSTGQTINMMSTDASKVDLFMGYAHFVWATILPIAAAVGLLIRALGPSALAGIAVILIIIPLQGRSTISIQKARKATAQYTDSRVKVMNEILSGIRVIKVYAWENSFMKKLNNIRMQEMVWVRRSLYIRAVNIFIMSCGPVLMSVLAFIVLGLTSDDLNPADVFSAVVLFNLLRLPLLLWPMTFGMYADAKVAFSRIQNFLIAPELDSEPTIVNDKSFAIKIENASFAWEVKQKPEKKEEEKKQDATTTITAATTPATTATTTTSTTTTTTKPNPTPSSNPLNVVDLSNTISIPVLNNINLIIPHGSLVAIVGPVGSGKSSLLSGIIGEMRRITGSVYVSGSLGYCSQSAWIQNASVRDNILFGLPYNESRYNTAISVCALSRDLEILPAGDLTEIGEKGINLSGGQKQRVNLARGVYFNSDILLMDDPLSAVDTHVAKHLFEECILGALSDKTRILVTHQLHYMPRCDLILLVKDGKIVEQGDYNTLMNKNKGEFKLLMETYVVKEEEEEGGEQQQEAEGINANKTKTKDKSNEAANNKAKSLEEAKDIGAAAVIKPAKSLDSEADKIAKQTAELAKKLMTQEERQTGSVGIGIYLYYAAAVGGYFIAGLGAMAIVVAQAENVITSLWLSWWSEDKYDRGNNFYIWIYAVLGGTQCLLTLVSSLVLTYIGCTAAIRLHDKSFAGILRGKMSFFDTTPLGRIINRFSRDQDVIDSLLTDSYRQFFTLAFSLIATFILICILLPYFTIALVIILFIYLWIQSFYRATSREIKRLDAISKSPLFANFSETLTGLPTIRAYRQQTMFTKRNEERLDANNRPYYIQLISQRWLALRLESIGALIIFCTALICVIQRDTVNAATLGLIVSYALTITFTLNFVVRGSVDLENNMNSVERSKYYTENIPIEALSIIPSIDNELKSKHWPSKGAIEFKDYSLRYRDNLPLVLNNINLKIQSGQKVGIVGRTGAGKSSLSVAIFRLVESCSGNIYIDNEPISNIGLDLLRSSIAIIPQDPVLYSGTIRSNLDPFNLYSDNEIWSALEKSYLSNAISKLTLKLESIVNENGDNFSVGQRCQICLARAMLRNSRILIMDEATASVDLETDSDIQHSITKNFNHCTILTIAHRLNTIIDYDRICVLDFGQIKEFDTPANLLRNSNSLFSNLVNETGEQNAAVLKEIAFAKEKGIILDYENIRDQLNNNNNNNNNSNNNNTTTMGDNSSNKYNNNNTNNNINKFYNTEPSVSNVNFYGSSYNNNDDNDNDNNTYNDNMIALEEEQLENPVYQHVEPDEPIVVQWSKYYNLNDL